ncbi:hypothetical protein QYF36_025576 [Acer negundo]|nr:hypothetical protein QYF36_025576 [Acer negundo]
MKRRVALNRAGNLTGFDLRNFDSEAELTRKIVDNISKKLKRMHIEDIINRYRVHIDEDAFHDDIVNFKKRYYSGHKDEDEDKGDEDKEPKHISLNTGEQDRGNEDKEPKHTSSCNITAEWIFVTTNLILEVPSAVFDKLSSVHKPQYALVSMLMSFMTMLICIIQLVYQGREGGVGWKRREKTPWFYYPPPSNKPFEDGCLDMVGYLESVKEDEDEDEEIQLVVAVVVLVRLEWLLLPVLEILLV